MKSEDQEIVLIGKAISHPMRLAVIRDLRRDGEGSPVEFSETHATALANASYHFSALFAAGVCKVIRTEQRGGGAPMQVHALTGPRAGAALAVLDLLEGLGDPGRGG